MDEENIGKVELGRAAWKAKQKYEEEEKLAWVDKQKTDKKIVSRKYCISNEKKAQAGKRN